MEGITKLDELPRPVGDFVDVGNGDAQALSPGPHCVDAEAPALNALVPSQTVLLHSPSSGNT